MVGLRIHGLQIHGLDGCVHVHTCICDKVLYSVRSTSINYITLLVVGRATKAEAKQFFPLSTECTSYSLMTRFMWCLCGVHSWHSINISDYSVSVCLVCSLDDVTSIAGRRRARCRRKGCCTEGTHTRHFHFLWFSLRSRP